MLFKSDVSLCPTFPNGCKGHSLLCLQLDHFQCHQLAVDPVRSQQKVTWSFSVLGMITLTVSQANTQAKFLGLADSLNPRELQTFSILCSLAVSCSQPTCQRSTVLLSRYCYSTALSSGPTPHSHSFPAPVWWQHDLTPNFSIMQRFLTSRKTFAPSLVQPANLLALCCGSRRPCGASMAAVEELPEKLGWGFANILVKGKKGLLICLYLP